MAMELILLEDVNNLGSIGDRVRVADGYARNYLLPRNLAAPLTEATLRQLEAKKRALQQEAEQRIAVAQSMAEKIDNMSVTIPVEAMEDDTLYGSVGEKQIAEALAQHGIEINEDSVHMDEHIRQLGVYNIDIQLHPEVQTSLKLWVVRK
ncbi:MAG: 50S ribosomal protein L9 [Candidatus Pacebacteria bacterium]|nr:50S ribosomal protein L9 [Candidatus Paceibacterota bacterium]